MSDFLNIVYASYIIYLYEASEILKACVILIFVLNNAQPDFHIGLISDEEKYSFSS